jgi:hypothetical protein
MELDELLLLLLVLHLVLHMRHILSCVILSPCHSLLLVLDHLHGLEMLFVEVALGGVIPAGFVKVSALDLLLLLKLLH